MRALRAVFQAMRIFRERRAKVTPVVTQRPMPGDPEAQLTELERTAIEFILVGDHPNLDVLRTQLADCVATKRVITGVGFFTLLKVADKLPPIQTDFARITISGVTALSPQLSPGAGFLLFLKHGYLSCLEGCDIEPWDDIPGLVLKWYEPEYRKHLLE